MWNGNSPIVYQDPSGYCFEDACIGEALIATEPIWEPAAEAGMATVGRAVAVRVAPFAAAVAAKMQPAMEAGPAKIAYPLFHGGVQEIPGGAAGAIRNELRTGAPTAGRFHMQKGAEEIGNLEKWLSSNPNASPKISKQRKRFEGSQGSFLVL